MASSNFEQLVLELINDARLDPLGNAGRYITSYSPLTSPQSNIQQNLDFWQVNGPALLAAFGALTPRQPLAWNDSLANAARTHDQAMIAANQQAHVLPGEQEPGARMAAAGYAAANTFYWGENIFAAGQDPLHVHAGFMVDWGSGLNGMQSPPGHRNSIMGIDTNPAQPIESNFREIGIGVVQTAVQSNVGPEVVTQDFGGRGSSGVFLLGVAYNDADENKFYSIGEGLGTLNVAVGAANATSFASGGYVLQTGATGAQTVTFTGAGLAAPASFTTTFSNGQNIKLDVIDGHTLNTSVSGTASGAFSTVRGLGLTGLTLTTDAGNQTLVGTRGNDTLNGGSDNDTLHGGVGSDTMNGGTGNDWYYVDNAGDAVTEAGGQGTGDRVLSSITYALGAGVQVEIMSTTSNGGTGALNLTGNEFPNTIYGNAGANRLDGKGGIDSLAGFGGNDWYYVDNAADVVNEGANAGADRVFSSVSYALNAGTAVETLSTTSNGATAAINLTGNAFANTLYGNAGPNVLNGGGGADSLAGFAGNDWYYVDNAADAVNEGANAGADRVFSSVSYALNAGSAVETLSTTNNGGTTAINLTGNAFANTLYGNAGTNVLNGGLGNDTLVGLGGTDFFLFNTTLNASSNVDRISDYNVAADTIRLEDAIFTALGAGALPAAAFRIGAAAADAEDRIIYNSASGDLFYDPNGNAAGGLTRFAILPTALVLTAADFFVV